MKKYSITSNLSSKSNDKSPATKYLSSFCRLLGLNGPLSYAFIYGSWEIVRARKVGTTHTKVDYVVYRLFYPVIVVGVCLFAILVEEEIGKFFCLVEVWVMILNIMYAFLFLQNVLANNLHRDNVKHRQKIPERLVVTDEIVKGGRKFYICKRYSILPTEKLYYTERVIWFLFSILASMNIILMMGHLTEQIEIEFKHDNELERLRVTTMAILIFLDVILTPIPMHVAHAIFPVTFYLLYLVFLALLNKAKGIVIYVNFDLDGNANAVVERSIAKMVFIAIVHFALAGVAALRDYVISLLDDSRTPKQLQNLRSQKRLARRKIMNYIEGRNGRITGITLEKRKYDPGLDEFIKTAERNKIYVNPKGLIDRKDPNDDGKLKDIKIIQRNDDGDTPQKKPGSAEQNVISRSKKVKLATDTLEENDELDVRSTMSSITSDHIEAIKKSIKRLPTVPKDQKIGDRSSGGTTFY